MVKGVDIKTHPFLVFQNNDLAEAYQEELSKSILNQDDSCDNLVSNIFFSKRNMQEINNLIRYTVLKKTNNKFKIPAQSEAKLMIVMTNLYSQYAKHLPYKIEEQINELNYIVVTKVVPGIITNLEQYIGYLKDSNNPITPINRPINVNNLDKTLPSISNIFK